MSKNKQTRFYLQVPVIPFRVMILVGYNDIESAKIAEKFLGVEISGLGATLAWEASNDKRGVIAFTQPPSHATIAHECFHLTHDILTYHNIKASTKGSIGELVALVSDYLVGKITEALLKRGFKIKAFK